MIIFKTHPEIIQNGFRASGITKALSETRLFLRLLKMFTCMHVTVAHDFNVHFLQSLLILCKFHARHTFLSPFKLVSCE